MNALERRIEKIEAAISRWEGVVCIARNDGETDEECLWRHGFDPADVRGKVLVLNEQDVNL